MPLNVFRQLTNHIWRHVALRWVSWRCGYAIKQNPSVAKLLTCQHIYIYIWSAIVLHRHSTSSLHCSCLPHLALTAIRTTMTESNSVYPYPPSHAAPIVLSIILAASLVFHIYQGL